MRKGNINKLMKNSPLVEITYKLNDESRKVYAKCEWFSLTGSIKDRVAYRLIKSAISRGKLREGQGIVEVSSGNMGISLTAVSRYLGYDVTIILPKFVSLERKALLSLYGANIVEVEDFDEAFKLSQVYEEMGYFCPRQFENTGNASVHSSITAKEILNKIYLKDVKVFVCGIGTSGTLTGVGKILKKKLGLKVYAIEPDKARIITSDPPYSRHELQGLSDEVLPKLYNEKIVDGVIQITDDDAIAMSRKLCRDLGFGVGISSGANFLGAVLLGENSVTIFPDDNKKYLSTHLMEDIHTPLVDSIELIGINVL